MSSQEKIIVGMSGGVDSAVAALSLKRAGFEVVGLFMKNWEDDDDDAYCSTRQDLIDCAAVADVIGIELEAVNFAAEYKERVFSAFLAEYGPGARPIRTCYATPKSSSGPFSITPSRSAPGASRPATMQARAKSAREETRGASNCSRRRTRARIRVISCTA